MENLKLIFNSRYLKIQKNAIEATQNQIRNFISLIITFINEASIYQENTYGKILGKLSIIVNLGIKITDYLFVVILSVMFCRFIYRLSAITISRSRVLKIETDCPTFMALCLLLHYIFSHEICSVKGPQLLKK